MRVFRRIFQHNHILENKDSIQDVLLLLYLLEKGKGKVRGDDILKAKIKLLKLVFLSEQKMIANSLKGFNFFFNIYKYGPSSKELLRLIDDLQARKLITLDNRSHVFSLTQDGKDTIEDFISNVKENEPFFTIVDGVLEKYGNLSPDELIREVYAMDIKPIHSTETINIGQAVKNSPKKRLLMKIKSSEARRELSVPDDWVKTMNILMNPEFAR